MVGSFFSNASISLSKAPSNASLSWSIGVLESSVFPTTLATLLVPQKRYYQASLFYLSRNKRCHIHPIGKLMNEDVYD